MCKVTCDQLKKLLEMAAQYYFQKRLKWFHRCFSSNVDETANLE